MNDLVFSADLSEKEEQSQKPKIPRHVAIIMDGNRRWAMKNGLKTIEGHWKGAEVLSNIVSESIELGVKVLTVYSFSTENWNRSDEEIEGLMTLFSTFLKTKREMLVKNGIKLEMIGDLEPFPENVKEVFCETQEATKDGNTLTLVLALNYGGRDELRRSVLKIIDDVESGKLQKSNLTEECFSTYLDTKDIGDPDLLIRTSGENRISNFLIWQISYSEVYISDVLWPEFSRKDFVEAIGEYQRRERRRGG